MKTGAEWCDAVEEACLNWVESHAAIGVDCTVGDFINVCKIVDIIEQWRRLLGERTPEIHVVMGEPKNDFTKSVCEASENLLGE